MLLGVKTWTHFRLFLRLWNIWHANFPWVTSCSRHASKWFSSLIRGIRPGLLKIMVEKWMNIAINLFLSISAQWSKFTKQFSFDTLYLFPPSRYQCLQLSKLQVEPLILEIINAEIHVLPKNEQILLITPGCNVKKCQKHVIKCSKQIECSCSS